MVSDSKVINARRDTENAMSAFRRRRTGCLAELHRSIGAEIVSVFWGASAFGLRLCGASAPAAQRFTPQNASPQTQALDLGPGPQGAKAPRTQAPWHHGLIWAEIENLL